MTLQSYRSWLIALLIFLFPIILFTASQYRITDAQSINEAEFYLDTISPQKAVRDLPITFRVGLSYTTTTFIQLGVGSQIIFRFGEESYISNLANPTTLWPTTPPNYGQTILTFQSMTFPETAPLGVCQPEVFLSGTDGSNEITATLTSPEILVEILNLDDAIHYVPDSLSPTNVIQGEPVAFQVIVNNAGSVDITLSITSSITLTDGIHTYTSTLLAPHVIPAESNAPLEFHLQPINPDFSPGIHPMGLDLHGSDGLGHLIDRYIQIPDAFQVWANQTGLVELVGTLQPTDPDSFYYHVFTIQLTNTLGCPIELSSISRLEMATENQIVYDVTYDHDHSPSSLPPGGASKIVFNPQVIYYVPDGSYNPFLSLFGTSLCDGMPFSTLLESSQTVTVSLAESAPPNSNTVVGGGESYYFSQFGGVLYLGQLRNNNSPRQALAGLDLECEGGAFLRTSPYPFYLRGGERGDAIGYFVPPLDYPKLIPIETCVNFRWRYFCPGAICATPTIMVHPVVYLIERMAEAGVSRFQTGNTFIQRGQENPVYLDALNSEYCPEDTQSCGVYTVQDNSHLRILSQGNDVTSFFTTTLQNPGAPFSQQMTAPITFTMTAAPNAPLGKLNLDANVTSVGTYNGGDGVHFITGTITASTQITMPIVYLADQIPLEVVPGSLEPSAVIPEANEQPFSLQINNLSTYTFTLDAGSWLRLEFLPLPGHWEGALDPTGPMQILPGETIELVFLLTSSNNQKQDGTYYPNLHLQGSFQDGSDNYPFHQKLDTSSVPFYIDSVRPVANLNPLPEWSPTSFLVNWYGSDNLSGIESYKVQYIAWEQGTYWFTTTMSTSGIFTGEHGTVYRFTVSATDKAGNVGLWSPFVQTTVDVLPPTSPSIPGVSPFNPNIHLECITNDSGSGVASMDFQVKVSDQNWADWLTDQPSDGVLWVIYPGREGGNYAFRCRAKDKAGNLSEWGEARVVGIIPTPPTAALEALPEWSGQTFTVTWSGSDEFSGIAGYDVQYAQNTGPWTDWLISTILTSTVYTGQDSQTVSFRVRATDGDGILGDWSAVRQTSIDLTPPFTSVLDLGEWQNDTFEVSWSANDLTSGIASYDVQVSENDGSWTDWLTGVITTTAPYTGQNGHRYAFRARARDVAGNVGNWSDPRVTNFDSEAPSGWVEINEGAAFTTSEAVTLTLSASDMTSGVSQMQVSSDGVVWGAWESYQTTSPWSLPAGDGIQQVYVHFSDRAGNISSPVTDTIVLDTQSPETDLELIGTPGDSGWWRSAVNVRLTAQDATSGVESIQYRIDGSAWNFYLGDPITITGNGPHTVGYKSSDRANNIEFPGIANINIDTLPPTTDVLITGIPSANQWYTSAITVSFIINDQASGAGAIHYDLDNQGWQTFEYSLLLQEEGLHPLKHYGSDIAGNEEAVKNLTIKLDKTSPTTRMSVLSSIQLTTTFMITWTGTDLISGISGFDIMVRDGDGPWTNWLVNTTLEKSNFTGLDGHTYYFRVQSTDWAGNKSDWSDEISMEIKLQPPTYYVYLPIVIRNTTNNPTTNGSNIPGRNIRTIKFK